ncbi:MAG: redoxin family protein [Myxococcales bacterium]|nr:redoxin family protein [Myxococcales bacterium]
MSKAEAPSTNEHKGLPDNPNLLYALLAVLAVGLGIALYLVRNKLALQSGLAVSTSCNFGGKLNCDAVNTSDYSTMFGMPSAFWALPTYATMAFLTWLGIQGTTSTDEETREKGRIAMAGVAMIAVLTVVDAMYMGYIMVEKIGFLCVYCLSLYGVAIASTLLAISQGPKSIGNAFSTSIDAIKAFKAPVSQAVMVLVVVGMAGYIGTGQWLKSMEAQALECVKNPALPFCPQGTDGGPGPVVVTPPTGGNTAGGTEPVKAPPRKVPTGRDCADGPNIDPRAAKIGGKKTKEDGWTEVQWPIDEDCEFVHGPRDAKVTVIKVADFQCSYCRYLALTLDGVMKAYEGKSVRFIMKNFPMNGRCNPQMSGYDKHPNACEAAWAGRCAGRQGKFWEMHDELYANQQALAEFHLDKYAQKLKLDMTKFRICMKDPKTKQAIKDDITVAYKAGIWGTPRTYINGRLVTGSGSKAIFKYHIDEALKAAESGGKVAGGAPKKMAAVSDGTSMIAVPNAGGKTFYMDAYEGSIDKGGKAVSKPGAVPARVSWLDAKSACEKAGKRMCTEQEWVTACAGAPAVDNNNNGMFGDDAVEGSMYPYGKFYSAGTCNDQGDKYHGNAIAAGSKKECRTASAIFDLSGNISEWVGGAKDKATLMGGHASSTERAACNQRAFSAGIGRRNHTTGFRCCADSNVKSASVSASNLRPVIETMKGQMMPKFVAKSSDGKTIDTSKFKGKVTLVNYFASWCGPCKKEFPYLVRYQKELGSKGFQVISIGVDNTPDPSLEFAKKFGANFPVITDPDSVLMGKMMVYSMPASFLIDKSGKIVYYHTGFKPEEDAEPLKQKILSLL